MDNQQTLLADLVCTRISHDMVGNIGAIAAALELSEDGDQCVLDKDAQNILTAASETLKVRQKFFRVAFGTDTTKITAAELKQLGDDYLNTLGNRAAKLDFECNNISADLAKIICLCLMIGAEVCIKGGHINIHIGRGKLAVSTQSDYKLAASKIESYQAILAGKTDIENASQFVQLIYLRELLSRDVPISLKAAENQMDLIIG